MDEKLMKKVEKLGDGELRALQAEIETMLSEREGDRRRRAEERRAAERTRKGRLEEAARARIGEWVEYEWTRCGNPRHKPCRAGAKPHGPYWYHYFTDHEGTYTSRYVGKHLDARAAEILEAHLGKREARMALVRGDFLEHVEVEGLAGLTPEEVYPSEFVAEQREKVLTKAARGRSRDAEAAAL